MRFSIAILILIVFGTAVLAIAQKKTITNADLEKYRQARLQAEREYHDNYVRLGQPSPEELERRNEKSRAENAAISEKLRVVELQREWLDVARERYSPAYRSQPTVVTQYRSYAPAVIWSYGDYGRGYRNQIWRNTDQQQYYVGGGQLWPIRSATPSRPAWIRRK